MTRSCTEQSETEKTRFDSETCISHHVICWRAGLRGGRLALETEDSHLHETFIRLWIIHEHAVVKKQVEDYCIKYTQICCHLNRTTSKALQLYSIPPAASLKNIMITVIRGC